jgi:hypothetical protein
VQEIVARLAAGEPVSAVTRDLNQRGIPSPAGGKWYRTQVTKTGMNPAYIAKRIHHGKEFDGNWPALVSARDHYAVVRRLSDPSRKVTRPGRHTTLLSWLAVCGECGAPLKAGGGSPSRPGRVYACSERGCCYVPMADMDRHVAAWIREELKRNEDLRRWVGQQGSDDEASVRAQAEADRLERELNALAGKLGTGSVTAEMVDTAGANLRPMIEALRKQAAAAAGRMPSADDILAIWDTEGLHWQREMVGRICSRVALYKAAKRGRQPFDGLRVEFAFRLGIYGPQRIETPRATVDIEGRMRFPALPE